MPKWMRNTEELDSNSSTKDDLNTIEIKPEDLENAIKPHLAAVKTEIDNSLDAKLKPMNDFFAEQKRIREEVARKAAKESEEVDPTDFLTDPEGATDKKLAPILRNQAALAAMMMRKETLGELDYYNSDPTFKQKVDELIESQPLGSRANTSIIMNAYKSVYYDMQQEIKDGKVKSKLAGGSSNTGGTGGFSGDTKDKPDATKLSDEEKMYAKKMGISEADWAKSKMELEYV